MTGHNADDIAETVIMNIYEETLPDYNVVQPLRMDHHFYILFIILFDIIHLF